ncbi:hypothetical protein ASF49_09900 [Methylobacterium sp. Leaf104]|uniref:hypothetical protein n=1 Tax=Methylobacterium TaxID=407 RepID=UPI0006F81C3F|nr:MULTISPECIES: hypothetical protein [Methylobacterium]KQP31739.1 hypothetical protein ASF49_09900 [Methylobacterium sp. Leaf104]
MSDGITRPVRPGRVTLDGQLVSYWEREAQRLEALAGAARWNWSARSLRRKAERARAEGARFAAREAGRRSPAADASDPADGPETA